MLQDNFGTPILPTTINESKNFYKQNENADSRIKIHVPVFRENSPKTGKSET